jgi:hypothetical protein
LTIKNKDKQQDKLAASSAKYLSTNNRAYNDQDIDYDDDSANDDQHSVSPPPTSLTIRLPVVPKYAPEYRYFQISKYDIEYTVKDNLTDEGKAIKLLASCGTRPRMFDFDSFPQALQGCLADDDCENVLFDKILRQGVFCSADVASISTTLSSSTNTTVPSSSPKVFLARRYINTIYRADTILPRATLYPSFNQAAQEFTSSLPDAEWGYVSFNPGLLTYKDKIYGTLRISNNSHCNHRYYNGPYYGSVGICEVGGGSEYEYQTVKEDCHEVLINPEHDIDWDPRVPYIRNSNFVGTDDTRGFTYRGRPWLATMIVAQLTSPEDPYGERVGRGIVVTLFKLSEDLKSLDGLGVPFRCEIEPMIIQKNWMPLVVGDDLYMVTRVEPLTIVKTDVDNGKCTTVYAQEHQSHTSHPILSFVASESMSSKTMHGGSPWMQLDDDTYLGIGHSREEPSAGNIYYQHFMIIKKHGLEDFTLAWVSDRFRLPRSPTCNCERKALGVSCSSYCRC